MMSLWAVFAYHVSREAMRPDDLALRAERAIPFPIPLAPAPRANPCPTAGRQHINQLHKAPNILVHEFLPGAHGFESVESNPSECSGMSTSGIDKPSVNFPPGAMHSGHHIS